MDINLRSVLLYGQKESIQTDRLLEICVHLKHKFFADIARHLPEHYTKTQPRIGRPQIPNSRTPTPKRTPHHPTQPAQRTDAERLKKTE